MPSDKAKNILTAFGEGADVLLQDSLSKSSRPRGEADISDGETVEITTSGNEGRVPNPLGRAPIGAFVVQYPDGQSLRTVSWLVADENEVSLSHVGNDGTWVIWVF